MSSAFSSLLSAFELLGVCAKLGVRGVRRLRFPCLLRCGLPFLLACLGALGAGHRRTCQHPTLAPPIADRPKRKGPGKVGGGGPFRGGWGLWGSPVRSWGLLSPTGATRRQNRQKMMIRGSIFGRQNGTNHVRKSKKIKSVFMMFIGSAHSAGPTRGNLGLFGM